jgi:hypothetical protein
MNRKQIGDQHAAKLTDWFERNEGNLANFRHADGSLYQSRIASDAGVPKQIFTSNPLARALAGKYGAPVQRSENRSYATGDVAELLRKKDTEIMRLRDQLAKREIELDRLRRESVAFRQKEAARELMLCTMRRVSTPPLLPPDEIVRLDLALESADIAADSTLNDLAREHLGRAIDLLRIARISQSGRPLLQHDEGRPLTDGEFGRLTKATEDAGAQEHGRKGPGSITV